MVGKTSVLSGLYLRIWTSCIVYAVSTKIISMRLSPGVTWNNMNSRDLIFSGRLIQLSSVDDTCVATFVVYTISMRQSLAVSKRLSPGVMKNKHEQ
jgi:hypothetical protein